MPRPAKRPRPEKQQVGAVAAGAALRRAAQGAAAEAVAADLAKGAATATEAGCQNSRCSATKAAEPHGQQLHNPAGESGRMDEGYTSRQTRETNLNGVTKTYRLAGAGVAPPASPTVGAEAEPPAARHQPQPAAPPARWVQQPKAVAAASPARS